MARTKKGASLQKQLTLFLLITDGVHLSTMAHAAKFIIPK